MSPTSGRLALLNLRLLLASIQAATDLSELPHQLLSPWYDAPHRIFPFPNSRWSLIAHI
jgi:hypothetical protein